MNAHETVRFFDKLGYECRRLETGGWTLAPRGTRHTPLRFRSLGDMWHEWRLMLRRADMVEQSLAAAVKMCRNNEQDREEIRRWAASGAMEELRDDLDFPMCVPYIVGNELSRFSQEKVERLAPHAWRAGETDLLPRILQWLSQDDRERLSRATAEVSSTVPHAPRL